MKIKKVWFEDEHIFVQTDIGHIVGQPVEWFKKLKNATKEEREDFTFDTDSIRWEKIDEDLSLEGFFRYKVDTSDFVCFNQNY